jgi:hypothetical protein
MLPALILHSDWSTAPRKRWVATAMLRENVYHVSRPDVANAETLVSSALRQGNGGSVILGFDFPIGIPRAYAQKAHIGSFLEALPEFGGGRWQRFYDLASRPDEVSVARPFYPARPGGTQQDHLVRGIGVSSMDALLRRCDFGNGRRNKACSLFWTLGGNQVGRAAISGWRDVLVPAVRSLGTEIGVWPFEGELSRLLATRSCVIAETYPADACIQLGLAAPGRGWSKRDQQDRIAQADKLHKWARSRPIDLRQVKSSLDEGFGRDDVGEDRFDAAVGLFGMLDVVLSLRGEGAPRDGGVKTVEGWILGQPA